MKKKNMHRVLAVSKNQGRLKIFVEKNSQALALSHALREKGFDTSIRKPGYEG